MSLPELSDLSPPQSVRRHRKRFYSEINDLVYTGNEWIYGPSGCGKSKSVRDSHSVFYWKDLSSDWSGYNHQDIILIEDLDPATANKFYQQLKQIADHYSFYISTNYGYIKIRPLKLIVTSMYSIESCFPDPHRLACMTRLFAAVNMGDDLSSLCNYFKRT